MRKRKKRQGNLEFPHSERESCLLRDRVQFAQVSKLSFSLFINSPVTQKERASSCDSSDERTPTPGNLLLHFGSFLRKRRRAKRRDGTINQITLRTIEEMVVVPSLHRSRYGEKKHREEFLPNSSEKKIIHFTTLFHRIFHIASISPAVAAHHNFFFFYFFRSRFFTILSTTAITSSCSSSSFCRFSSSLSRSIVTVGGPFLPPSLPPRVGGGGGGS